MDSITSLEEFMTLMPSEMFFKKTKDAANYKKNYIISNNGKRITLKLNKINIPFGVESFNGKSILNIEIIPKTGNDHYNIHVAIQGFEKSLSNPEKFKDNSVKNDIDGKGYYQNMRKSKLGYIIRTYIFTMPNVFSSLGKMCLSDAKDVKANVLLELGTLWINENNYGILWYVKSIEILHSM